MFGRVHLIWSWTSLLKGFWLLIEFFLLIIGLFGFPITFWVSFGSHCFSWHSSLSSCSLIYWHIAIIVWLYNLFFPCNVCRNSPASLLILVIWVHFFFFKLEGTCLHERERESKHLLMGMGPVHAVIFFFPVIYPIRILGTCASMPGVFSKLWGRDRNRGQPCGIQFSLQST